MLRHLLRLAPVLSFASFALALPACGGSTIDLLAAYDAGGGDASCPGANELSCGAPPLGCAYGPTQCVGGVATCGALVCGNGDAGGGAEAGTDAACSNVFDCPAPPQGCTYGAPQCIGGVNQCGPLTCTDGCTSSADCPGTQICVSVVDPILQGVTSSCHDNPCGNKALDCSCAKSLCTSTGGACSVDAGSVTCTTEG